MNNARLSWSLPLLLTAAGLLTAGGSAGQAQEVSRRPNIVLLFADDLGWTDLSSRKTSAGNGSRYYQTPNLDRLADQGVSFTSAYACQNCVPSRAALMTGQYSTRTGVFNVGSLERGSGDGSLSAPAQGVDIRSEAITVAETLKRAGYGTAHIGKFHVSTTPESITAEHGFDVNYGGGARGDGGSGGYLAAQKPGGGWTFKNLGPEMDPFAAPYTAEYVEKHLKPYARANDPSSLPGTPKHLTDAMADAAVDFIGRHRAATPDRPFFVNVAFNAVHTAVVPRADLGAKYAALASEDPRHKRAPYAGLLEGMDQSVGRILDYLDDPNRDGNRADSLAQSTLVLFVSDNGGFRGMTNNAPLRGFKGMFWEGGLRVPLIARLPGVVPAGKVSKAAVHVVDFYPTMAELAKAPLPDAAAHPVDGRSFAGVLKNPEGPAPRSLFWHFPGYLDDRARPCSTLIKDVGEKRYKLIFFYEDRHYELYDLTADEAETTDLLKSPSPAVRTLAETLSADLRGWLTNTHAPYPKVKATGETVAPNPPSFPAS